MSVAPLRPPPTWAGYEYGVSPEDQTRLDANRPKPSSDQPTAVSTESAADRLVAFLKKRAECQAALVLKAQADAGDPGAIAKREAQGFYPTAQQTARWANQTERAPVADVMAPLMAACHHRARNSRARRQRTSTARTTGSRGDPSRSDDDSEPHDVAGFAHIGRLVHAELQRLTEGRLP